ncbi:MAG: sugar phosphate isomerase/epimerase family protein [Candidatus Ranarchaeia archaeon]
MVVVGLTLASAFGIPTSTWIKVANLFRFEHIEFSSPVYMDLKESARSFRGGQIAFHAPYRDDFPYELSSSGKYEKDVEEFLVKLDEACQLFKVPVVGVIVHPPKSERYDEELFFERLRRIRPLVLIENLSPGNGPASKNWQAFLRFYNDVNDRATKKTGFCFDVPHAFIAEGERRFLDIPSTLLEELCSPRGYIHISGTRSTEDMHWPINTGDLPLDQVMAFLKKIRFRGTINMEISPLNCPSLHDYANGVLESYLKLLSLGPAWKQFTKRIHVTLKRGLLLRRLKPFERQLARAQNSKITGPLVEQIKDET